MTLTNEINLEKLTVFSKLLGFGPKSAEPERALKSPRIKNLPAQLLLNLEIQLFEISAKSVLFSIFDVGTCWNLLALVGTCWYFFMKLPDIVQG